MNHHAIFDIAIKFTNEQFVTGDSENLGVPGLLDAIFKISAAKDQH